jgi:predicted nucleic acid-binding protein
MERIVTLVDTSSWIEALRADGNSVVRERVRNLLIAGDAVWCDLVRIELWNGARGAYEIKKLAELEAEITTLSTDDRVWALARDLAKRCRKAGKTIPAADLVIGCCALHHGAALEYTDPHFDVLLKVHKNSKQQ